MERLLAREPDFEQRLEAYERLREMRRALGIRHLPPATQFEFARQRHLQTNTPGKTDANGCAWSSAGPTNLNGRVTSIAIDPTNNQRIYAATFGGIFRSQDAGRRWQRVSDDWLATVFSVVVVNPSSPNEIFAGGGDKDLNPKFKGDGIWRSTNYGAPGSWTKLNPIFDQTVIYRIRIDPLNGDVYVAASNGAWKGKRNGANIDFTTPMEGLDAVVDDLAVDFSAQPRKLYAAVRVAKGTFERGIYKSTTNPEHWIKSDSGIDTTDTEVILLGLAASNPDVLYAKVTVKSTGMHQGFYRTASAADKVNGNDAWEMTADSAQLNDAGGSSWFNNSVEVDPTNEDRVVAGGGWPFVTTTGGLKFDRVENGKDPNYVFQVHGDMHAIAFDPVDPNIVYVGNDGGIDKSTDMSKPDWHWTDVSHGMVATMFYNMTSNRDYPTTIAGGSQDNGIEITFGNRTWYKPVWCDGLNVGTDAKNPITLYASCNGGLTEFVNPIPGTDGGGNTILFDDPVPKGPLATDINMPGRAVAAMPTALGPCVADTVATTVDGLTFTPSITNFPNGALIATLAIAPSSSFKTFLVAVKPDMQKCPTMNFSPFVVRTDDGGTTWTPTSGLPNLAAAGIAFDPNDPLRSYVMYQGLNRKVYMSTGAGPYVSITGTAPTALPAGATRIVVDPWDSNVLYAATPVGVFRGVITLSPLSADWAPFDEGLPDSLDVNDLWVDPKSGILTIATFGHGAYRRDINPDADCKPSMLLVRDNVYDDGRQPSVSGIADAEHPIGPDFNGFYKPDDSFGGKVQWYLSHDIRIDVPDADPPANLIPNADHVEFELCPITVSACEAGTMIDSAPQAGKATRVYVQVTNRGIEPVANTRVIALWAKSSTLFPSLPESFWTQTFPAAGKCGTLDPATKWHLVDPLNPCRLITSVNPEVPEVARFDWLPPLEADGGATFLTIIESDFDTLDPSIRKENKLIPYDIVAASRHIALRSTRTIPFDLRVRIPRLIPIDFPHIPYEPMGETEIVVSNADRVEAMRIVLPGGVQARAGSGSARPTRIEDPALVRQLIDMRLDPSNAWELSGGDASLMLDGRTDVGAALIATPAANKTSSRFYVTQRSREQVFGGVMVLFRAQAEKR